MRHPVRCLVEWIILSALATLAAFPQPSTPDSPTPTPSTSATTQPIKLNATDSLKVRELEVAYERARADQANLALQYQQAERAVKELGEELNKLLGDLRQRYKCHDCGLNDKDLTLEKKVINKVVGK